MIFHKTSGSDNMTNLFILGDNYNLQKSSESATMSKVTTRGLTYWLIDIVNNLKPSKRGELEITDLNKEYLNQNKLNLKHFTRGTAWFDTGTIKSLNDASNFVEAIQERQGLKIACLEEIAFIDGLITDKELIESVQKYKNNEYGKYLENLLNYE